ncbi:MAG: PD40 domain-containing protein [Gemmatimonadetes bacterium]|nr:PD40 domain-containing protein [Gemmatimonadota bacterium]
MRSYMTVAATVFAAACGPDTQPVQNPGPYAQTGVPAVVEAGPDETRLGNLRMLTNGGENAEAYFSADARQLIFQATRPGVSDCDQIYTMNSDGTDVRMVSTGKGATTCAFFFPSGDRIVYSSTHEHSPECPPRPDYSQGYVWSLHPYDIYTARPDGSDLRKIGSTEHYDAEATISPDGSRIVFTSTRDGDLEIYTMNPDGTDIRRLTNEPGYDGGAFFSPDGTKIVYRARHPETPGELADYRRLLAQNLIRPSTLDIYVMDVDGSNRVRVTNNGAANFAPYMHPDGRRIIFSSNMDDPDGRNFELYLINVDGTGLERITNSPDFDGFPMFSADGTELVFASNRNQSAPGETNVFIADWRE